MFEINGRIISPENPPYIIAELSANHNGSLIKAKESILKAKECGASAIKIQTYTADSMTINCDLEDFKIKGGLWDGYNLYELYKEASTPYEWHNELFTFANENDITLFSTPFDENAVDFLNDLGTPAFKIASFELLDLPLIKYAASKGKPLLLSTGMGSLDEITDAVNAAYEGGCDQILLFHCISSYPTPTQESNIRMISFLKDKFGVEVGLSDHTLNNTAAMASLTLGASAFEKHFTLSRLEKGPDSQFSIEPNELKELVKSANECWQGLSRLSFSRSKLEQNSLIFRRSLYFVKDLSEGQTITKDHIRKIRPGFGLSPKFYDKFIGKKVSRVVKRGERVNWEVIN
tara:strand:+ start:1029 stop:2069 length:1041 start_codon:yes stop_codon:yes gene_type:complete